MPFWLRTGSYGVPPTIHTVIRALGEGRRGRRREEGRGKGGVVKERGGKERRGEGWGKRGGGGDGEEEGRGRMKKK